MSKIIKKFYSCKKVQLKYFVDFKPTKQEKKIADAFYYIFSANGYSYDGLSFLQFARTFIIYCKKNKIELPVKE